MAPTDESALRRAITQDIEAGAEVRPTLVAHLKRTLSERRDDIRDAFEQTPRTAVATKRAIAALTDTVVRVTLDTIAQHLHPNPLPSEAERLAVLAVGGYGRAEMAPQSDVDLLFVTPAKLTPWAESLIEDTLYVLWDLRLKIGQASRTLADCLRLAREDYTIRTTLIEMRPLWGDNELPDTLQHRLRAELFDGTAADYIEAKLDEREARHTKQGGQRYMVEPNVKEGKGGLRDLQSLYWIGKYVHGTDSARDLVGKGVFTEDEYATFERAEDFLWAVRCHLHYITGRPNDQLGFDVQVEVAARMGYTDSPGRRGVEKFMQDYFRHATAVGDVTRIFLTALEASHVKTEPILSRLFRRRRAKHPYAIAQSRLTVADETAFLSDPINLLRLFDEALRTGTLIHPDAMRLIASNLDLITDDVRRNPTATKLFLGLLLKHDNPERALRRMNELGILSAFIPEFARIVAMMQFNMYHHYTVDEHTIQVIHHLAMIERGELTDDLPLSTDILANGVNRRVLYIALLLHDIGKGMEEDHSITGARIARTVAPRLGLKPKEAETVEWLVRYHLLMSDMAQKRDISEPRTVRDFAKAVRTVERLDLLTVLTVCDIRGVGPGTWNNWKAQLIRNLYHATRDALENGLEDLNRETRETEARAALRGALDWTGKALKRETGRHYGPYWQGLPLEAHVTFAHLLRDLGEDDIRIDMMPDEHRDATRVCFAVADHPGLFSRLTGALALVGANVVDARTYTTRDGFATAVFWVQDSDGHPYEADRLPRMKQTILRTLRGEVVASDALAPKDRIPKRERAFRVPTTITFDNEGSAVFTIIEVDSRDRPGLLYDLTRALAAANVYISSAVIATYGEQVVDTFYVKDMFGLKFHSPSKQQTLEKRLKEAITKGAARAAEAG